MDIEGYLDCKRQEVDQFLQAQLSDSKISPSVLGDAIRYSLLGNGKRIRPILTIAAAEAIGSSPKAVLPIACAFELIHTYSLIHDDLPVMDNDDFRRGKLANHKVYGEAMAILAGDGLQAMAFEWCSRPDLVNDIEPSVQVKAILELTIGAGNCGMVKGQVLDMQAENQEIDLAELQDIHAHKTGKLICASVRAGAILSSANKVQLENLTEYAEDIGLAFQIVDDVLNVTSTYEELGKGANTDAERGKQTYPSFYGLEGAKNLAQECAERAVGRLRGFDSKADPLRDIAGYVVSRRK